MVRRSGFGFGVGLVYVVQSNPVPHPIQENAHTAQRGSSDGDLSLSTLFTGVEHKGSVPWLLTSASWRVALLGTTRVERIRYGVVYFEGTGGMLCIGELHEAFDLVRYEGKRIRAVFSLIRPADSR
jgi:hypothetical protein